MPKFEESKVLNGTAARSVAKTTLYSSPVQDSKVDWVDLNRPTQLPNEAYPPSNLLISENSTAVNKFVDSVQFEGSVSATADAFQFNQGFRGSEPLVVLMTEFLSLFDKNGEMSDIGKTLQLKHDAKILNIKTALEIFQRTKGFKESIEESLKSLEDFIYNENSVLNDISNSTQSTVAALDLSSYSESVRTNIADPTAVSTLGFVELLESIGYRNTKKFSNTKIWQQFLIELKKTLMTHSQRLLGTQAQVEDSEKYTVNSSSTRRIWLNPYISMPSTKEFSSFADEKMLTTQKLKILSDLDKSQYYDLSSPNVDVKSDSTSDINNKNATQLVSGDLGEFAKKVHSSQILDEYAVSGRDISVIANAIFKEISYSSALVDNQENSLSKILNSRYGYTISTNTGDNFRMWDHVVGRFPTNVTNVPAEPTGNGNSLVSLSQKIDGNYQVLTFEKDRIQDNTKNFIPGNLFYIESSLNAVGATENDFSRLDRLIESTNIAITTLEKIYSFIGYKKSEENEYQKLQISPFFTLDGLIDKLSIVSQVYKSCLDVEGQNIKGLKPARLKDLQESEAFGTRLAAIVCSTAVNNTFNDFPRQDIKSLLFMWMLNTVMFKVERSPQAATAIEVFRNQIVQTLKLSAPAEFVTPELISIAADQGRLFPLDLGTNKTKIENDTKLVVGEGNSSQEVTQQQLADEYYNTLYKKAATSKLFKLNSDKGLWKVMIDCLTEVYNSTIFVAGQSGSGNTRYSGISKTAFLYAYFDLMLRIVAAQTPEFLWGIYNVTYAYPAPVLENITKTETAEGVKSIQVEEIGMLVAETPVDTVKYYFDQNLVNSPTEKICNLRLKNSINYLNDEENFKFSILNLCSKYVKVLNYKLAGNNQFKQKVEKNLKKYSNNVSGFFSETALSKLDAVQRASLFNLSMAKEQVIMNQFILSEYKDKLASGTDCEAKLKKNIELSKFPSGFSKFLNMNDTEITSYELLSPYFKSNEFRNEKSNNKKIISVGIPPKMLSYLTNLSYSDTSNIISRNLIRVRLYKIDRLRPKLVYKTQSYLFEMNRFPTRVLANWDIDLINLDDTNILRMPTKLYNFRKNSFKVCKNYAEGFPTEVYGSSSELALPDEQRQEIYANHIKSFLAEEYLRWVTDAKFDETRYYQYSGLTKELTAITNQYQAYLTYLNIRNLDNFQPPPGGQQTKTAMFFDPLSKVKYTIPISNVSNDSASSTQPPTQTQFSRPSVQKKIEINMDSTMVSFFQNETILSESNDKFELRKKCVLPKKFDRVFNIIFDPDDFEVEGVSAIGNVNDVITEAVNAGLIVKVGDDSYKHRDTSFEDVTFDEYFVTVEPYDYKLPYTTA